MSNKQLAFETFKVIVFCLLMWTLFFLAAADGQEIVSTYKEGIASALKQGDSNKAKALAEGLAAYQLSRAQDAQRKLIEENSEIFKGLGNLVKSTPKVARLLTAAQAAMGTNPTAVEAAIPLILTATHQALTKGDFDVTPLVNYFAAYAVKEKARKAERSKENLLDEEIWKLQKELNQLRKEREIKALKKRLIEERQRR